MAKKRLFTISTITFPSLKAAENKILEWQKRGNYKEDSQVYEVAGIYKPITKKIVTFRRVK